MKLKITINMKFTVYLRITRDKQPKTMFLGYFTVKAKQHKLSPPHCEAGYLFHDNDTVTGTERGGGL